jgi:hypothetical protein
MPTLSPHKIINIINIHSISIDNNINPISKKYKKLKFKSLPYNNYSKANPSQEEKEEYMTDQNMILISPDIQHGDYMIHKKRNSNFSSILCQ